MKNELIAKPVFDLSEAEQYKAMSEAALKEAKELTVTDDGGYTFAATAVQSVKKISKAVTGYFKPIKDEANAIVKTIRDGEREATSPLNEAELLLKAKMGKYRAMKEEQARRAAEEAAAAQRKAAEEMLAKAVEAEQQGDSLTAAIMQESAAMAEQMKPSDIAVTVSAPKTEGVSVRKIWKAEVTDESQVPVKLNGMTLRPVDTKLLGELARTSKGRMQIPGVRFYSEDSIAVKG